MAGFRAQLFKLVFGNEVSLGKLNRFLFLEPFKHTFSLKFYRWYYISGYIRPHNICNTSYLNNYSSILVLPVNTSGERLRREMPPKAKRSASTKTSEEGKRKKSSRKNDAGSSDENGAEGLKTPSRQSQRNINKVVTYKDEDFSEDELPKKRAGKINKRAKSDEDSDLSGSEDAAAKSKKVSKKKKHKAEEADDLSDNDSNDSKSKGGKKKSKSQDNKDESGDEDGEGDDDDDDDDDANDNIKDKTKENKNSNRKAKSQDDDDNDNDDEPDSNSEGSTDEPKAKRSKNDQASTAKKSKGDKPMLNKTQSDFESLDFSSDKTTSDGEPWNVKISSWNVGGLKAWVKKNGNDFIKYENPDIFCLQETKCSESKLPPEMKINGYNAYWLSGEKEGYAGVALLSKEKPINVTYGLGNKEFDNEGRVITAEYEKFYLVAAYVPNAGRGLVTLPKRMKWDPVLRDHIKTLDSKKPVVLCGDLNVSHQAIDLANPKTNTKSAGFTQEERDGMTALLGEGFVDSFRHLYPEKTGAYTFWTYMGNARSRNTGWRLDYFILSERLTSNLCDNIIRSEVYGSDHCPITLLLNI